MKVRPVKAGDIATIAAMMAEFEAHLSALEGKKTKVTREKALRGLRRARFGETPHVEGLIAEGQGKALGYLTFSTIFDTDQRRFVLLMSDLFVAKAARRKGVGKLLMKHLREEAKKRKCSGLLWTVWNRNPQALAFYLGMGAKPETDEIVMSLKV
jgi:GNAT superfamily N-acetyltransferase